MSKTEDRTSDRTGRTPLLLASTVFLDLAGFGMILPILPFYGEHFGATAFEIGLLFASYSLAQFLLSPVWGRLSDRLGRRPLLLTAIALSCGAYVLFALAKDLAWLFVARTLAGAAAANYTIAQAYVGDVTRPEERAKSMGKLGAAFGMGFIAGPALGGFLSQWGATAVPAGAALLAAVNLLLVWKILPEPQRRALPSDRAAPGVAANVEDRPQLLLLLALYGTVILGFSAMEATLALFCEERLAFGMKETAWLLVFVGVLMVVVQGGLIGSLVARYGERRLLVVALAAMAVGLFVMARVESLTRLLVAASLLALGSGLHTPTSLSLMSRLAAVESQGGVLGLARSIGALGRVIGPIWGGWAFHRLGSGWPFLSGGLLIAASAVAALPLLPHSRAHRHLLGRRQD